MTGIADASVSLTGTLAGQTFDAFLTSPAPIFTNGLDPNVISAFAKTDSATVRQLLLQFETFLDNFSVKAIDNNPITVTESTTIGDVVDLPGTFQQELLDQIELPPHTAATPITVVTDGELLGTSGNASPEFRVTLQDARMFDVDLDANVPSTGIPATTVGHLTELIAAKAAADGILVSDFAVFTNANGSLSLVDYTTGSDDFKVEPFQDGGGEDYAAASNLSLTATAAERDVNDDDNVELVIDVAPNPGPNFDTVQQMVALANAGANTNVTGIEYDRTTPAEPKLRFHVGITKQFADAQDTLSLINLGPLTDIVTNSQVTVDDPTVTLDLPFELLLTNVGFDNPLSINTLLSELNFGEGVAVTPSGTDDLQITLVDGTAFAVDLDTDLASTPLASLNGGGGVRTAAGPDLNVLLNDGTAFDVDLNANVDSTGSPPVTLGELFELIQAVADANVATVGDFVARVDSTRGTLSLIDKTVPAGAPQFTVSDVNGLTPSATDLGLNGAGVLRKDAGDETYVIENSLVTLGQLISRIETAASNAGLTLPTAGDPSINWQFDTQIVGDTLALVDRTSPLPSIIGTATANASATVLTDNTKNFAPDSLLGRTLVVTLTGGDVVERTIIANTADTITVESDWDTPPAVGDSYRIPTTATVVALNDSQANFGLGLASTAQQQPAVASTPLFDGNNGVYVATTGNADLTVQLSGGTSFPVDLDPLPTTVGQLADRIRSAAGGLVPAQFDTFVGEAGDVYLIDRGRAGAVGGFTVSGTAAADLRLDQAAVDSDVDYADNGLPEYAIRLSSSAVVAGGRSLHGDTPSTHLSLADNGSQHIRIDAGLSAASGVGSGLFGPLAVGISDLAINSLASNVEVEVTFEPATLRELTTGLPNPFNLIDGEAPVFQGALDLDLDLEPQPAIAGVTGDTDFTVDIVDIYEVLAGDETINWGLPNNNQAGKLLVAVENLTIDAVIDYLGDAADYLVELETESTLGDLLPGMSQSVGQFLGFGASFKAVVEELDKEPPSSLQALQTQLAATASANDAFTSGPIAWSFDTGVSRLLKLDTDLTVDPVTKQLPLTLNLQQVNPAMLATLGLSSAGIIVDTFRSSPLSVTVDGSIGLDLGIDLSNAATPSRKLVDTTQAAFRLAASSTALNFQSLLARCPSRSTKAASFLIRTATACPLRLLPTRSTCRWTHRWARPRISVTARGNTNIAIAGEMDVALPLELPTSVLPTPVPTVEPFIAAAQDLSAATGSITTNLGNPWPTLNSLLGNLSLDRDLDGFKVGFNDLFVKLDQLLDKTIFASEFPFVGKQLVEAVNFVEQIRVKVKDNLDLLSDVLTPVTVRQALYDALGPEGLGWLLDDVSGANPDTAINIDDIVVNLEEVGQRVVGVTFELTLASPPQRVDLPVDLDLILPGLGLEIDALADVKAGFTLPLTLGVKLTDGVFVDVSGSDNLMIDLELALPTTLAVMTGNPNLTFSSLAGLTIVRDRGSWHLEGFLPNQRIKVRDTTNGNDGDYLIQSIDADGLVLTLKSTGTPVGIRNTVNPEGPVGGISIEVENLAPLNATLGGLLPYRVNWNHANTPTFTGALLVDLKDVDGNGNNRLSSTELLAALPGDPPRFIVAGAIPGLAAVTEDPANLFSLDEMHLKLETALPVGTPFPPYRMDLDITNWVWDVAANAVTDTGPLIGFNNVQFELVDYMKYFVGAALQRLRVAFEPLDGLAAFLESEAFPILSLLFGKKDYLSATNTFGGKSEIGDFIGASLAIKKLVDGGKPFKRDFLSETLSDLAGLFTESNEFDEVTLVALKDLTGEAWINLGNFTVDSVGARRNTGALFDANAAGNQERALGEIDDPGGPSGTILGQIAVLARILTARQKTLPPVSSSRNCFRAQAHYRDRWNRGQAHQHCPRNLRLSGHKRIRWRRPD